MSGFIVPPMPAELVAALRRVNPAAAPGAPGQPGVGQPGVAPPTGSAQMSPGAAPTSMAAPPIPIRMGPRGMNASPTPPGVSAAGIPSAPMPSGAKLPAVTDDPSVPKSGAQPNQMGEMPKPQNLGSYLNPDTAQYQHDLGEYQKTDEANRIDPQQVKPRLWERLLGFALGATQLKDPQNAGAVASQVVNRRRDAAELQRTTALAPWTQRLDKDKEGLPLAELAARTGYEQGELDLKTAGENRERAVGQGRIDQYEARTSKLQDEVDHPKQTQPKNADEALVAASAATDAAEKSRLIQLAHDLHQQEIERARESRPPKEEKDRRGSPAQFKAANDRKNAALVKAKAIYDKETEAAGSDPVARKQADDNFKAAEQAAQDGFEQDNSILGGEPTHQNVESWRGQGGQPAPVATPGSNAAPAAAPAAKPAAQPESSVPNATGPKDETPVKTATDGKTKIGYYKSTGQWMLVPQNSSPTSGGK